MTIKMFLQDGSANNKRRKIIASGGYVSASDNTNQTRKYAGATTANVPITKTSQFAGSGANVVFTQPMFFSPMHTPQNWQIASKRREVYQWAYLPYSQVLTSNFTYKNISDLDFLCDERIVDVMTGGYLYPNIDSELILGASGEFRKPIHFSERECVNKKCFEFNAQGYYRSVSISEEHPLIVLEGKLYRHKIKLEQNDIYRKSIGISNGVKKIKIPHNLIIRKEAKDISIKDYLLSPLPQCGKVSIDNDLAWSIGLCIADGCLSYRGVDFTHGMGEQHINNLEKLLNSQFSGKVGSRKHGDGNGWRTSVSTKESINLYSSYIEGKLTKKRFKKEVFELDKESRLHLLGGYFDGDGSFNKQQQKIVANNYSCEMSDQLYWLLLSCGVSCSLNKVPLYGEHYKTNSTHCYRIIIPSSEVPKLAPYMKSEKIPTDFVPKKQRQLRFLYTENGITYLAQPIDKIREFKYTGKGYDIQVDPERSFVSSGYVCSNCRFYYSNEPKVAAGVDFYSNFSMNGFKLECKNKKVLRFYESLSNKLKLTEVLNEISHEYFLIGDVFPFLEIDCPYCGGKGVKPDGSKCVHPDGSFKSIKVMNPDYMEVKTNPLANEAEFFLIPDEELRMIIQRKEPRKIYERLPQDLIKLVAAGQPIPLSSRCVSHIKHNASPYGTFGTSLLQRLFTVLAYKTKIMTANWIVAERLILPIRVVKVGNEARPATETDLQDVVNQLAAVANDPNLTVVTHHAFEYEWYGACHAKQTEILTDNGFKMFVDLKPDDLVASYNKETRFINFVKPQKYHEYDFNGELIRFKHNSLDIAVTPNHRMLIERNGKLIEVEAQYVQHNDKMISTANWEGTVPVNLPYKESPLSHLSLEEFLKFVGYYISEGGCQIENNKNLKEEFRIQACGITQKIDSEHYKDIFNICNVVSKGVRISKDNRGNVPIHTFMFPSQIARYLANEFGVHCGDKTIPNWIKNLPSEYLSIIYQSMMNGDGCTRQSKFNKIRFRYNTTSKKLSDDFSEILLKMGYFSNVSCETYDNENRNNMYRVNFSEKRKLTKFTIRNRNILREKYNDKVYCVTVDSGFIVTRFNGKITIQGNSGKIHDIKGDLEEIGKEILDGLMLNQAILNGDAAGYSSAQVGIEVLICRLENWRNKLKDWVEKHIFLPIAMMQGFYDEEESKTLGERVYLYPRLIWNDLQLRDKTNKIQSLMQLYEKGIVSAQTILEELGLDYDTEIEKIRDEQVIASANGMVPGGQQGGGMGGGMPGGDMGGGGGGMPPAGGDMGGGMPPAGGDMGGGMGAPGGAMGGDPGGMPGAQASALPKITKKGKGSKQEEQQAPPSKMIKFTKLEQKMYKILKSIELPQNLFAQYAVRVPGEQKPFMIDFAYPKIGVGVEADGTIWHQREDFIARDKLRDQKLANVGWRIIRFKEDALDEHPDAIKDIVYKNMIEASKSLKKAAENNNMTKYASVYDYMADNNSDRIGINITDLPNGYGEIIEIGIIE